MPITGRVIHAQWHTAAHDYRIPPKRLAARHRTKGLRPGVRQGKGARPICPGHHQRGEHDTAPTQQRMQRWPIGRGGGGEGPEQVPGLGLHGD